MLQGKASVAILVEDGVALSRPSHSAQVCLALPSNLRLLGELRRALDLGLRSFRRALARPTEFVLKQQ